MLEDFFIADRLNLVTKTSGMDSKECCVDENFFDQYPYEISYNYNSRGFRDTAWPPESDLDKSIWCIGDSFTLGLGVAYQHTWPQQLQTRLNQRCINVSLDGASNQWISRRTVQILQQVQPDVLIIQWSFLHRRELDVSVAAAARWRDFYSSIKDSDWPNCDSPSEISLLPEKIQNEIKTIHGYPYSIGNDTARRAWFVPSTDQDDFDNFHDCVAAVQAHRDNCCVIHSAIPEFAPPAIKSAVDLFFQENNLNWLGEIKQIDVARDGYHYGIRTTAEIAQHLERMYKQCKKY